MVNVSANIPVPWEFTWVLGPVGLRGHPTYQNQRFQVQDGGLALTPRHGASPDMPAPESCWGLPSDWGSGGWGR